MAVRRAIESNMLATPIFILSNPRSGSTLLRYCLDAHPSICCPAELRLGAVCQALAQLVELTTSPDTTEERIEGRFRVVRSLVDELLGRYCQLKGKSRWCEKSPANLDLLQIISAVFPDAHYICLHRNPLDVVRSTLDVYGPAPPFLQEHLRKHANDTIAAYLDRWCGRTERLLAFERAHQGQSIRMKYEEFVSDPEGHLGTLSLFLQVTQVPGLSKKAFATAHDHGPGDIKIRGTERVEVDRIGKGTALGLSKVSPILVDRMGSLLVTGWATQTELTTAAKQDVIRGV